MDINMTNEIKNKVLSQYLSKRKWGLYNVFGCEYWGTILNRDRHIIRILVYWHGEYQILTITNMFHGALTKVFYKDTAQIDDLIRIINSYRKNR